jgi:hypothetical protein
LKENLMERRLLLLLAEGNPIGPTGPGAAIEIALALLTDLTSAKIRALMRVPPPGSSWWTRPQVPAA